MAVSKWCRRLRGLAFVLLGISALAQAEPSAELTCLLGSGDLLKGRESRGPKDPPWQSLASPRRGDENRARLALAATDAGFLPGVTTDARLRLELQLSAGAGAASNPLRDLSSSLGLAWRVAPSTELGLRAYPLDTDYLRLGYLHALDWGGTDAAHGESVFVTQTGAVPGLQLSLLAPRIRLFSAAKWATVNDALRGERRLWGMLSGGSFELSSELSVDAGFGYFQRAALRVGATSAASFVEGASLRLVWHRGVAEPELAAEPFRPPPLREDPSRIAADATSGWALALEGVALVQRLRRFEAPSAVALAAAPAGALYGSVRGHGLAVHAAAIWRSLAFVLRNDARLSGGETLPTSSVAQAELTAWLGGSITGLATRLVPSAEVGVRLPAALQTPSALPGFGQTLVAGGPAGFEGLPVGAGRLPVVAGRLGLRWQASPMLNLALFGEYQRDPNRVTLASSPDGVTRAFGKPDSLTVVAGAQARF
jgi:hypothetical protein